MNHTRNGLFQGQITEPVDLFKAVPVIAKKGSAIFFTGLTPHASLPNKSSRPRRTVILGYRAADAFPIYLEGRTPRSESLVRVVRGARTNVARCNMSFVAIPNYPRDIASLYELQDLSRQGEVEAQHASPPAHVV